MEPTPRRPAESLRVGANESTPRPEEGAICWNMTTACNYRCSYCTQRDKKDRGRSSTNLQCFFAAFHRLPGRWEIKLSGGEPFVHPDLDEIVGGLAALGHRISIVTNLSASAARLASFARAGAGRVGLVSASLHLEYVSNIDEFLDRARGLAADLEAIHDPTLPSPSVSVSTVATRAALPRLLPLADKVRERGFSFKVQPEKQHREVMAYSEQEQQLLLSLGGHNRTGRTAHHFRGLPCWAGARYFILDDTGQAHRCYPARRYRLEPGQDFLSPNFRLANQPLPCLYDYCNCTVPIARGMMPSGLTTK